MNRFTVFGYGYVGEAYATYLHEQGYEVQINDPPKGYVTKLGHFIDSTGAIVCVPADTTQDGLVDYTILLDVIHNIRRHKASMPILIKTTILPDLAEELEEYDNITYSPEYLTERNWYRDVEEIKYTVLGGKNPQLWADLFADLGKTIHITDMKTASFMKYAVNTFLSTKVTFMNELHDLYGGDWNKLKKLLELDARLGTSHFDVPGPDGKRGYGGSCFPKDVKAFLTYAEDNMAVLRTSSFVNRKWR